MSSRPFIVHQVANTQPNGQQLGDEWFNPTTNILTKTLVTNGNAVSVIEVVTNRSGNIALTGNVSVTGNIVPTANASVDLGTSTLRWRTVFTSDLDLSNGVGDWTIVEGEDDLFLYNNKKGRVYKFALIEVDPATATPKINGLK